MKIHSVSAEFSHTNGQRDRQERHDKSINWFSQFCPNRLKQCWKNNVQYIVMWTNSKPPEIIAEMDKVLGK